MSGRAIATPTVFPDQGEAAGLEIPARLCREPGGGAPEGTLQGALRNAQMLTLILNLPLPLDSGSYYQLVYFNAFRTSAFAFAKSLRKASLSNILAAISVPAILPDSISLR